jgi:hypothetical protein
LVLVLEADMGDSSVGAVDSSMCLEGREVHVQVAVAGSRTLPAAVAVSKDPREVVAEEEEMRSGHKGFGVLVVGLVKVLHLDVEDNLGAVGTEGTHNLVAQKGHLGAGWSRRRIVCCQQANHSAQ